MSPRAQTVLGPPFEHHLESTAEWGTTAELRAGGHVPPPPASARPTLTPLRALTSAPHRTKPRRLD